MVKSKKKAGGSSNKPKGNNNSNNSKKDPAAPSTTATAVAGPSPPPAPSAADDLDSLQWLRECDTRRDADGEAYLQLEYQEDDELMVILKEFLEDSRAQKQLVKDLYQIWQQTVLSTLLASSALWKKESVQSSDQRLMKDQLKTARYKINFIMHHTIGGMLSSSDPKWKQHVPDLLQLCYQTLQLLPRLAESCPHHKTDIRQAIIHFEGKEFLAAVACESWDTLYDYSIPIDPERFIPILRRCAMLDILDKDWNMLGGWEDILKGLEARCCLTGPVLRLPCDSILHEQTTILRNARNSMQCKFFSVRFMRYTEDQAPQRWRYFPKCSAPACANIETLQNPHPFRCKTCWYFHYCSESCREYCDTIMGLHPKFCRDTPKTKAALCQRETEQYLGWTSSSNASSDAASLKQDLLCHACGTSERLMRESGSSNKMKMCTQCKGVFYCSKQCAIWDWRVGGHKQACVKAPADENGTTTKEGDSATTVKADKVNGAAKTDVASSPTVPTDAEPMN